MNNPLLAHQIELERLYNKNQLISRIKAEFTDCKEFSFENHMIENNIKPAFGYDLLVQMVLHKRTSLPVLIGVLRKHFDDSQLTADELIKCAAADLVNWHPAFKQFIVIFDITSETQKELDMFQFPLPMVVEPKEIQTNHDIGYLTSSGSVILRKNHHDDDVCLDHLNRMNKVKFSIDTDTATMIHNKWRNLDKPKVGETKDDFAKRVKAFNKYDRTARDVMNLITQIGNEFYLTHKYDKRGRVYSQGYHVNYQGNPWNKAVIELADKELVE